MAKLTEEYLEQLGFKKNMVSTAEHKVFHYYTLPINDDECLVSECSDNVADHYTVSLSNGLGICSTTREVEVLYYALTKTKLQ